MSNHESELAAIIILLARIYDAQVAMIGVHNSSVMEKLVEKHESGGLFTQPPYITPEESEGWVQPDEQ